MYRRYVAGGRSEGAATVVSIPEAEGGKCAKLSGVVEGEGGGFVSMRTRNFATPLVGLALFSTLFCSQNTNR